MQDLAFASAAAQAALMRSGEMSPVELTELSLSRISQLDPAIHSFVTVAGDSALAAARSAEAQLLGSPEATPPFLGVPIAIKDNTETAGIRTTYSSRAFQDHVPRRDAAVVRRLKEAGFIVLGKTNLPEFATLAVTESVLNGICRNPWDLARSPGGSSGGAAAAVAAGLVPAAHGNDGGGSIRIPASCCGLIGFKPSRGRISWAPKYGEVWGGLGTEGFITRTVEDAARLLDLASGYEVGDPYWADPPVRPFAQEAARPPERLRVAFTTTAPNDVPIDQQCVRAVEMAAGLLESLGHEVTEAAPSWVEPMLFELWLRIWQAAVASFSPSDLALVEPINRVLAEKAARTSSTEYVDALAALHDLARGVVAFWDSNDLLLTPILALPEIPLDWYRRGGDGDPWAQFARDELLVPPFLPIANITGQPALAIPMAWSDRGMPIGVQLIGPPRGEAVLLRAAKQIEEARPWAGVHPTLGHGDPA